MTEPVTLRILGENGQVVGVLRQTTEEQEKYRRKTKETGEETAKAAKKGVQEVGLLDKAVQNLNGSARDLARTLAAGLGFAGVASAVQYAIVAAREFNVEISKVSTALSDTSKLDEYTAATRKLAITYGISAKQQAASLYEIISAGQDADTAMRTLDAANRLAVGGLTTVETAADGLTSVMNAYAGKVADAAAVSDILFVGAAAGKTNIEQLSSTLGLVANTASVVGVSLEELVGSIATITLSGVQTSVAVTQMRAALNGVIKPSTQAAELAKKLGLQFDIAAIKTKGWAGFLEDVQEKTGGNTTALTTLFGSVEAVGAVLSLTGEKAEKFADVLGQTQAAAGATEAAFGKMSATADFAFDRAKQAATDLFITLGDRLLTTLAPLALAFADNIEAIAAALELSVKIGAAYLAVFVALPALYNAATVAAWKFVAALTAQNVGFVASLKNIGLMKAGAGALFALWAGWEIGTDLREKFVEVRVAGIALIAGLMKAFENLKYGVALVWEGIKLAALLAFEAITEGLAGMLRSLASVGDIQIGGEALFGDTVAGLNSLADSLSNAMDPIGNFNAAVAEQSKALLDAHAKIDAYAEAEIAFELTTAKAAAAQKANTVATKAGTAAIKLEEDATKKAKEALKSYTAGWKANAAARAAEEQALDKYEQSRTGLEDSYKNELELLSRTNEERRIGDEMLRFMSQNYDYLTSLTEEAARAELEHANAIIRKGEAGVAAANKVNALVEKFGQLDNMSLMGLVGSLDDVRKALEAASDPMSKFFDKEKAEQLRETLIGMNFEIGNKAIDNLRSATDAMAGLFEEGTEGQRRMQQVSAVLTVVQGALAAVEGVRAVLRQGTEGDPYSAFARMAAMAGAVAPLLAAIGSAIPAFGGGGGGGGGRNGAEARQNRQGTGTVLGDFDAKSESMLNALEITAEACEELVGINRGMLTALQSMQRGISGAAGSLARTGFADLSLNGAATPLLDPGGNTLAGRLFGSIFGGDQDLVDQGLLIRGGSFGNVSRNPNASSYQTIETDGGWFHSDDIDDELEALGERATTQIRLILTSIGDAVRAGAEALGLDAAEINRRIQTFRIEEIRISTMDLTGEEAQEELEAAFSAIFDDLAGAVVPFIDQFQQVGEGLGETLVRVATSVQVFQEGIAQLGLAVETLTPEMLAQVAVGLVEAAGGIEQFIEGMQSFVANFAPESHRFEVAQNALTSALEQVGLTLPTTRDGMWELMQSLDATTESGQAQIAALLRLSSTADAYYNFLEQRAQDAADAAEEAAQAERDRLDLISQARQINNSAFDTFRPRGNDREEAIENINRQINDFRAQLIAIGDPLNQSVGLEALRAEAIARANAEIDKEINGFLDDLAFDLNLEGLDEAAYALATINRQYDQYRLQLEAQGATVEQLNRLEELRTEALEQQTEATEAATRAAQNMTISLGDLFGQLRDYIDSLRESLANLLDPGYKSWINDLTGFTPATAATTATRSGTLATIGEQYAQGVATLTAQLAAAQAELAAMGSVGAGPERAAIVRRIQQLQQLLGEVTGTLADALDYANDLFDEQINGLLAGLRSEFGTQNPVDLINQRFDDMIEQATAWGASLTQLAEIEAFRIMALEQAEEQAFEQQMDWLRQLRDFRDSLLLNESLTTLTPAERLAEARAQYEATLAAAQAGDVDARNNFQGIAQTYLEELRSFFGSSDGYTQGFNRVLADIQAFLDGGVWDPQETSPVDAPTGTQSDPIVVNVDPLINEVVGMRGDIVDGFVTVAAELQRIGAKVDTLTNTAAGTTAAVDRLAASGRV